MLCLCTSEEMLLIVALEILALASWVSLRMCRQRPTAVPSTFATNRD